MSDEIQNKKMMRYYVVDAFTSEAFGGNPAGVVLLGQDGTFPDDKLMERIAAELRYSETAFVRQDGPEEFTVRYFTPCDEVDLCGHATIATFGVLRQEGLVAGDAMCLNHTLAGDLQVRTAEQVMMQMAAPRVIDKAIDIQRLHDVMAGNAAVCWSSMPVKIVSTGLPDIILPVDGVEGLDALQPDMAALAALSKELEMTGVHAFAIADDGYTAHVRNFAPLYGIPEESATGTANAALTHYLQLTGLVSPLNECRFLQGEKMGRRSVVTTMIDAAGDVWVGGNSRIIARGDLMI